MIGPASLRIVVGLVGPNSAGRRRNLKDHCSIVPVPTGF